LLPSATEDEVEKKVKVAAVAKGKGKGKPVDENLKEVTKA